MRILPADPGVQPSLSVAEPGSGLGAVASGGSELFNGAPAPAPPEPTLDPPPDVPATYERLSHELWGSKR
jgi:hypothetical protein